MKPLIQIHSLNAKNAHRFLELYQEIFPDKNTYISLVFDILNCSASHVWLAETQNRLIGFLYVQCTLDVCEVMDIGVLSGFRQQGIAKKLFSILSGEFYASHKIQLEVNALNQAAQSLYVSLGFVTVGRREKYYTDGADALLMDWNAIEKKEL